MKNEVIILNLVDQIKNNCICIRLCKYTKGSFAISARECTRNRRTNNNITR